MTASPVQTSDLPVMHLEITAGAGRLSVSASEHLSGAHDAAHETVRRVEDLPLDTNRVAERCRSLLHTLNTANRRARIPADLPDRLVDLGRLFADDLLPPHVKDLLRSTSAKCLTLGLDENLIHIPWELLHDGDAFLCRRFAMGRLVRTRSREPLPARSTDSAGAENRLLILADPAGDLNGAYSEGVQLRDRADAMLPALQADLNADAVSPDLVQERIRRYRMVHFAGHCDYDAAAPENSGWRLAGGRFTAGSIRRMSGGGPMPGFVFSNACQSARSGERAVRESAWTDVYGLASAFLFSGVRHYLGTFWEIQDDPGRRFSLEFYRRLFSGDPVGEAVRRARNAIAEQFGESALVWASYLLYGDPGARYPAENIQKARAPSRSETTDGPISIRGGDGTDSNNREGEEAQEEIIRFGPNKDADDRSVRRRKLRSPVMLTAAFLLFVFLGWLFFQSGPPRFSETATSPQTLLSQPAAPESLPPGDKQSRRQARRDRLIAALSAYQKSRKAGAGTDSAETAPSVPPRLWVLMPDADTPEHEEIARSAVAALTARLHQSGIALVERERLDALLSELDLGRSGLSDPETAPLLGRLLSARFLLLGRVTGAGEAATLSLRLVETETGLIRTAFVHTPATLDLLPALADETAAALETELSTP